MASNAKVLQITDYVGFDQYPIPNGRVADIGLTTDSMRLYSNNRPVVFIPQAFNWAAYGRKNSRWPTPDEVCAMTFVGLVHNVKGLLFYEFPAPKMNSKTCIQDIKPELWQRLDHLLKVLKRISPALLGAEYQAPFKQSKQRFRSEFRVIVSSKMDMAYLLAVNPWNIDNQVELDFSKGPLSDVKLTQDTDSCSGMERRSTTSRIKLNLNPPWNLCKKSQTNGRKNILKTGILFTKPC